MRQYGNNDGEKSSTLKESGKYIARKPTILVVVIKVVKVLRAEHHGSDEQTVYVM
jgi:hypothetical protein